MQMKIQREHLKSDKPFFKLFIAYKFSFYKSLLNKYLIKLFT